MGSKSAVEGVARVRDLRYAYKNNNFIVGISDIEIYIPMPTGAKKTYRTEPFLPKSYVDFIPNAKYVAKTAFGSADGTPHRCIIQISNMAGKFVLGYVSFG